MKTLIGLLTLTMSLGAVASAKPVTFASGSRQVALLELYTSEGCSSCPPAEAWLNNLKSSPELWKGFVPLAFHVDYWNSLGWTDRQSSPEFTQRQQDYARLWQSENVYTPEFVLNGREWRNWFGLRGAPSASDTEAGVLEISSTNNIRWAATFTPAGPWADNYRIHAALLVGGTSSEVTAGENRGSTLPHEFSVVELAQSGMTESNSVAHGTFFLNAAGHSSEKYLAVAAWVTHRSELPPLQATGGWLAQPLAEK